MEKNRGGDAELWPGEALWVPSMLGIDYRFAVPYKHAIVYEKRYLLGFNDTTFFSSTVP